MERGLVPSLCTLEDAYILTQDFEGNGPETKGEELKRAKALARSGLLVQKWVQQKFPDGKTIRTYPDGRKVEIVEDGSEVPL